MEFKELLTASFRGAEFGANENISTTGGRKIAIHEYAQSPRRFVEDLGLFQKTFKIEAITNDEQTDKLIIELEKAGLGEFVHPILGSFQVTAEKYILNQSLRSFGKSTFSLSFQISESSILPEPIGTSIDDKITELDTQNKASFIDKVKTNTVTLFNNVKNKINEVTTKFAEASAKINKVTDSINEFETQLVQLQSSINQQIKNVNTLATTISSLYTNAQSIISNPLDAITFFSTIASIGSSDTVMAGSSGQATQYNQNNQASNDLNLAYCSGLVAQAITNGTFTTSDELQEARTQNQAIFDKFVATSTNYDLIKILTEINSIANTRLDTLEVDLPKIREISTKGKPLKQIVFELYGNQDNFETVMKLNQLIDVEELPETIKYYDNN